MCEYHAHILILKIMLPYALDCCSDDYAYSCNQGSKIFYTRDMKLSVLGVVKLPNKHL
jgi:hypothetical protein